MSGERANPPDLASRLRDVQVGPREELEVSRHIFRGSPCYVLHDPITFHAHELSVDDYQIFVQLDGERTLGDLFSDLVERSILTPEREEDFYRFVVHLNQLGLLNLPVTDGKALYARYESKQRARRRNRLVGMLFLRVPLWQPDAFLARTVRYVAPLFSRTALVLWLVCILLGIHVIVACWDQFRNPLGTMLALNNLPILWLLLVGLKLGHEMGHAYACKHFGGRVPEMGAFFILLTPCAYVDASAAWGFPNRMHRIVVSLAGMYFESILALLALVVWCLTGPSLLHSAAQYAIVLSTVVTIGFNINPLMRYDGYYLVSDLVNVPNLRQLANSEVLGLIKRRVLGVPVRSYARSVGERIGLVLFGMAAGIYKTLVLAGICAIIAWKIPVVGLAAGVFYLLTVLSRSGMQLLRYVTLSEEVAPVRRRAVAVTLLLLAVLPCGLLLLPAPGAVSAIGTVAQRDDRIVRAAASGFLQQSPRREGDEVEAGQVIARLANIDLMAALRSADAEIEQLRIGLLSSIAEDRQQAAALEQRIRQAEQQRREMRRKLRQLQVTTPIAGRVTRAAGLDLPGRFVREGEPLATVSAGPWVFRAVATAEMFGRAAPTVGEPVEIRLAGGARRRIVGTVARVARAGSRRIEQPALTHLGGGAIPVAPQSLEAEQPFFEITIDLKPPSHDLLRHGMTGTVRFQRPHVSLARRLYRRTLAFLNRLRVAG